MANGSYAPEFRAADVMAIAPGVYDMPSPPQLEAKKTHPRIAAISDRNDFTNALLIPPPEYPKPGTSRFVLLYPYSSRASHDPDDPNEEPMEWFEWVNRFDTDTKRLGGGLGFSGAQLPCIRGIVREGRPIPELLVLPYAAYWLVAPRVLELLSEFGIDASQYVTATPRYEDGDPRLVDYLLFDPVRLIDSYDYDRSAFHAWKMLKYAPEDEERLRFQLTHRRAFREDIAPDVHLFRDLFLREETVISRALWHFLRERKVRGLFAKDPAGGAALFYDPIFSHLDSDPGPGVIDAD
jgi:hypothetical protein